MNKNNYSKNLQAFKKYYEKFSKDEALEDIYKNCVELTSIIDQAIEYVNKMFEQEPANSSEYDFYCLKLLSILEDVNFFDKVKELK